MSDTGQPPGADPAKAAVRARVLAARRALTEPVRVAAARRVQAVLTAAVVAADPPTMTGYVPIGTEPGGPDLPAVLAGALGPDRRLLLPVLRPDRALDWAVYQPDAAIGAGWRSATDPAGPRLGMAAIGSASLVVVPALAVDRRGFRLGRGGGSYDRALAVAAPDALVVALLHDGELLDDDLPVQPHDRRVSAVITPTLGLVPLPAG